MTALPATARHPAFTTSSASIGLLGSISSTYRHAMHKVMAQSTPRPSVQQAQVAAQANTLLREHNALGVTTL